MKVRYVGPAGDQYVKDEAGWLHVERSDEIEMTDALGAHLTTTRPRSWVEVATPTTVPAKPGKKTTPDEEG